MIICTEHFILVLQCLGQFQHGVDLLCSNLLGDLFSYDVCDTNIANNTVIIAMA